MKKRSEEELDKIREQAKQLVENKRYHQKQIALKCGISEKTLSTWISKYQWERKFTEIEIKRNEARVLIVERGFNQKEASAVVGVSEKTVGAWVKKYGWEAYKKEFKEYSYNVQQFIVGFKEYVMLNNVRYAKPICKLVDDYISSSAGEKLLWP